MYFFFATSLPSYSRTHQIFNICNHLYSSRNIRCLQHIKLCTRTFNQIFLFICYVKANLKWFSFLFTDIYYYQTEGGNRHFQNFCDTLLKHLTVKELELKEPIPERLFLVFFLPSVNRQNKVDVISRFITKTMEPFNAKGGCNCYLIICKWFFIL